MQALHDSHELVPPAWPRRQRPAAQRAPAAERRDGHQLWAAHRQRRDEGRERVGQRDAVALVRLHDNLPAVGWRLSGNRKNVGQ
jgi:hypothetical protein